MQTKLFYLLFCGLICIGLPSQSQKSKTFTAPKSDLGHIDLILDSAAFNDLLQDSFLMREFATSERDTTMYSKPSYDVYLIGREAFLHFSLAKAFWDGYAGAGTMIFQTRKPGKDDSLLLAWKQFYKDSLTYHTFKGGDFHLGEIMPYHKQDSRVPVQPRLTPILSSYSEQAYKNWGFNDAVIKNGLSMEDFMTSWDSTTQQKLFKRIISLHVQVTEKELKELQSALMAVGYEKKGELFIHAFNPEIKYTITTTNLIPKYTRVEIELAQSVPERNIRLGDMYTINVSGKVLVIKEAQ